MMKIAALLIAIVVLENAALAQPGAKAEDLYTEGQAAYDRADYATAIAKWQVAYDLSKEAGLLFNLAQAKRLTGDCAGAITTYRRFDTADADSTSEQHKIAKDFVHELEGTCPTQSPPQIVDRPTLGNELNLATTLNGPTSNRPQSGRTWKIAGLVTGGVGVAVLTVGLALGHHGASIGDEVTAACQDPTGCDWATLKDKDAQGKREAAIGKVLDVAGVAVIAGGVVFYYLGVRQETLTVAPAPGGGGGVISWRGSW